MEQRVVAWRGVGVHVTGDPAALDLLDQHLPPFFGGPGQAVAKAHFEGTEHLHVELPDGLSVDGPGLSMSGKSTLVRALVDAGATYLTDEFALLDPKGHVWPYPRKMTMRTPTGTERRLPERSAQVTDAGIPVALIADLVFSQEGWHVEPSTKGQTVMGLVANALPVRAFPARTLDCLTAAAATADGLRGTRGEAADAATALLALL